MKYLLDTDILSMLMRSDADVSRCFLKHAQLKHVQIVTSIFTHSEIWYGYYLAKTKGKKPPSPETIFSVMHVLPFTQEASDCFAMIKAKLTANGMLIKDIDMFIASIAITNNATLVSNNTRDFIRIDGLKLENWK